MGEDFPLATIGLFVSMDTLFPGSAGNLKLFTNKEVIALKSPISGMSTPKLPSPLALKMESDSSIKKRDCQDPPRSHRCPVSAATRSYEDLDKPEHECGTTSKQLC